LKPDLHVITSSRGRAGDLDEDYEDHAFLEVDMGTEHLPRIEDKCRLYAAYAATGAYQAEHGVFPAVVWLSTDSARQQALRGRIAACRGLPAGLFRVAGPDDFVAEVAGQP
jgi:hypothetical protein